MSILDANMRFSSGQYFETINELKKEQQTKFEVILLASQSHLAVGNLVNSYNILSMYFEGNEPIYQLPYRNKIESYPLGYDIFQILKTFRINEWSDALKRERLFPTTINELGITKNIVQMEFGENCFNQLLEISIDIDSLSITECIDAVVKAEMAIELSSQIDKTYYLMKTLFLEKLLTFFESVPEDDVIYLWKKGLDACRRMAK